MLSRHASRPPREDERVLRMPDGRLTGYAEYGDPGGWPLFYFHGMPGSRLEGQWLDSAAKAAGARVIALDRPGYGLSDDQANRRIADYPADVSHCADSLGIERFAVAGVSGGGPYAVACAAKLPQRVRAAAIISGVGPMDVPGLTEGFGKQNKLLFSLARKSPWLVRPILGSMSLMARRAPGLLKRQLMAALPPPDREVLSDPATFKILQADAREAFRHGSSGAAKEAWLYTRPWAIDLGSIAVPVVVWQGEQDLNVPPAMGRYLASAIPGAQGVFVAEAGHFGGLKHMDEIIEFLRPPG